MLQRICFFGKRFSHFIYVIELLTRVSRGVEDDDEHALAIAFFSVYADDHTEFRRYVLGQLASLVSRLQMHDDANERLCYAICYVSRRIWAIQTLLQTDTSNTLLRVLECVALFHS